MNRKISTLCSVVLAAGLWTGAARGQDAPSTGIPVAPAAPFAAATPNAKTTISEVRVQGNDRLSRADVLSYVKVRVGMEYDDELVRSDRNRLMATGRFADVTPTRKLTPEGVVVTFYVKERPAVTELKIEGAKKYPVEDLLLSVPLSMGSPLNNAKIEAGRQAILNKYLGDGYHFVQVTVDQAALAKDHAVIYKIVEGPRTVIEKVVFEGNHYFSNFNLRLKTETKAKLWPFVAGNLNNEKVERDVTVIRSLYQADGFLDAEVGRELQFSDDKTEVTVTFLINEGPRYRVNQVIFEGNRVIMDDDLGQRITMRQGDFYTTEDLRRDVKTLEDAYGEVGYVEASVSSAKRFVSPQATVPDWAQSVDGGNPALVNLIYTIVERDQYTIGEIRIQGNSITKDNVIRREQRYYPEQIANTVAIKRSESRLQQLRLFDKVSVTPIDSGRPGVKDILVEVVEGRTAEFLIGAGVSSSTGLMGTISFTQRNFDFLAWPKTWNDMLKPQTFKGAGQRFSLSAEPGTELMRFEVGWSTPYVYDQPYSVGVKGYLFTRDYDNYDERRLGVQASVGHTFKNRWFGELAFRLENINLDVDSGAPVEVLAEEGDHTLMGFKGTLVRDRTDSRWMPTEGDRWSMSYEQVIGTETFGKFQAGYKWYHTVYRDALERPHILAARTQFGGIVGEAPVFEKFYAGGIGSVRGFKFRGISPRGHYANGALHDDPIGGDMMFYLGGEYTFPLVGEQLRGVVFIDSGTVEEDFAVTTYRISAGVGVQWTIPFFGPVPMSFDFGFPIVKDETDDTQVFSFSLGWTF